MGQGLHLDEESCAIIICRWSFRLSFLGQKKQLTHVLWLFSHMDSTCDEGKIAHGEQPEDFS
jgi:hypothetical protein